MITWRIRYAYKILKASNGPQGLPLPHMTQYFLTDDNGNKLSFWNDLPLDLHSDLVTLSI